MGWGLRGRFTAGYRRVRAHRIRNPRARRTLRVLCGTRFVVSFRDEERRDASRMRDACNGIGAICLGEP
jgi:hypothetical protein